MVFFTKLLFCVSYPETVAVVKMSRNHHKSDLLKTRELTKTIILMFFSGKIA